jgi:hypothetical protein
MPTIKASGSALPDRNTSRSFFLALRIRRPAIQCCSLTSDDPVARRDFLHAAENFAAATPAPSALSCWASTRDGAECAVAWEFRMSMEACLKSNRILAELPPLERERLFPLLKLI